MTLPICHDERSVAVIPSLARNRALYFLNLRCTSEQSEIPRRRLTDRKDACWVDESVRV